MHIKDKGRLYGMESKKLDFETHGVRYEGKIKVVLEKRKVDTRARD